MSRDKKSELTSTDFMPSSDASLFLSTEFSKLSTESKRTKDNVHFHPLQSEASRFFQFHDAQPEKLYEEAQKQYDKGNFAEWRKYLNQASEKGHTKALYDLACCYAFAFKPPLGYKNSDGDYDSNKLPLGAPRFIPWGEELDHAKARKLLAKFNAKEDTNPSNTAENLHGLTLLASLYETDRDWENAFINYLKLYQRRPTEETAKELDLLIREHDRVINKNLKETFQSLREAESQPRPL